MLALEEFTQRGKRFDWRHLELRNDFELDEFQLFLIDKLSQNPEMPPRSEDFSETRYKLYKTNRNAYGNALKAIGVKTHRYRKNTLRGHYYEIVNRERFEMILNSFNETGYERNDGNLTTPITMPILLEEYQRENNLYNQIMIEKKNTISDLFTD